MLNRNGALFHTSILIIVCYDVLYVYIRICLHTCTFMHKVAKTGYMLTDKLKRYNLYENLHVQTKWHDFCQENKMARFLSGELIVLAILLYE